MDGGKETGKAVSFVQPKQRNLSPTHEAYGEWQFAYDYFGEALFGGRLPACLITLTRKRRTLGYFSPDRFENIDGVRAHEISLNPEHLEALGDFNALSVLVHEQCHLFRHEFGPKNRKGGVGARGYHDRAWAEIMLRVGLVPTDTGQPGGKQTGQSVSHMIALGGPFDLAAKGLLARGFAINWRDSAARAAADDSPESKPDSKPEGQTNGVSPARQPKRKQTRAKFVCPNCGLNAWAKPAARLSCTPCAAIMSPAP